MTEPVFMRESIEVAHYIQVIVLARELIRGHKGNVRGLRRVALKVLEVVTFHKVRDMAAMHELVEAVLGSDYFRYAPF